MASEKIEELAARMLGSCDDFTDETEELTIEECRDLDDLVVRCDGCSWHVEPSEIEDVNGEQICGDCR